MVVDHILAHRLDGFGNIGGLQQLVALGVDHLALVVGDIVVLQQLFADVEVARFDLALGVFDGAGHPGMLDRLAFRHLQAVHDGRHAVGGEDAQQRIFQRQVKTAGTIIALTPGAAAQLVVDAARLMALGADDVQTARSQNLVMHWLPFALDRIVALDFFLFAQALVVANLLEITLDAAAQHDVGTAAGHIGGDGDRIRPTCLRHDLGLARVLLGVEHLMRKLFLLQKVGNIFRSFD